MKDWINEVGTQAAMLIIILTIAALAVWTVVHDPASDVAKELIGAMLLAFGSISAHLFNRNDPPPPAGRPPA